MIKAREIISDTVVSHGRLIVQRTKICKPPIIKTYESLSGMLFTVWYHHDFCFIHKSHQHQMARNELLTLTQQCGLLTFREFQEWQSPRKARLVR